MLVGAGNKEKTDKVISTSLILSVIFPAVVILVLECLLNQLLMVFQTPTLIYQDAKDYLAIFLYMQLTSIFQSFGDPVFQMKGMLLGTVFNAIADPLFIKAFGISGAAIATVLSQVLCLIFAVIYGRKKSYFRLNLKNRGIFYSICD